MRIDLHTHSRASDGTQSPADLVRAAVDAGLDVLAITDHDTADGWAEAVTAAEQTGLTLLRGMEVSTRYAGRGVHLLAYLPDPTHAGLDAELGKILEGRDSRVPAMVERLQDRGIGVTLDDVRAAAGNAAATGRPHVADALVTLGVVADRDEAFVRYLDSGRPAYANRYAASLPDMIDLVRDAGGVSVIAHPWGRHQRSSLSEASLAELAERGLAGIEVDHQDHDAATRDELRAVARNLDLVATGSSDHHGAGKTDHDLGCNTTHPDQYARLLDLADASAAATWRRTPEVVNR